MQCEHCGAQVPPGERVCPICRTPLENPPELPLTTMECFVTMLLGLVPLAGTIVLCLWAFGTKQSHARCSLSRAVLLFQAAALALLASLAVRVALVLVSTSSWADDYDYYFAEPGWNEDYDSWDSGTDGWEPWMDEWMEPQPADGTRPLCGPCTPSVQPLSAALKGELL